MEWQGSLLQKFAELANEPFQHQTAPALILGKSLQIEFHSHRAAVVHLEVAIQGEHSSAQN